MEGGKEMSYVASVANDVREGVSELLLQDTGNRKMMREDDRQVEDGSAQKRARSQGWSFLPHYTPPPLRGVLEQLVAQIQGHHASFMQNRVEMGAICKEVQKYLELSEVDKKNLKAKERAVYNNLIKVEKQLVEYYFSTANSADGSMQANTVELMRVRNKISLLTFLTQKNILRVVRSLTKRINRIKVVTRILINEYAKYPEMVIGGGVVSGTAGHPPAWELLLRGVHCRYEPFQSIAAYCGAIRDFLTEVKESLGLRADLFTLHGGTEKVFSEGQLGKVLRKVRADNCRGDDMLQVTSQDPFAPIVFPDDWVEGVDLDALCARMLAPMPAHGVEH